MLGLDAIRSGWPGLRKGSPANVTSDTNDPLLALPFPFLFHCRILDPSPPMPKVTQIAPTRLPEQVSSVVRPAGLCLLLGVGRRRFRLQTNFWDWLLRPVPFSSLPLKPRSLATPNCKYDRCTPLLPIPQSQFRSCSLLPGHHLLPPPPPLTRPPRSVTSTLLAYFACLNHHQPSSILAEDHRASIASWSRTSSSTTQRLRTPLARWTQAHLPSDPPSQQESLLTMLISLLTIPPRAFSRRKRSRFTSAPQQHQPRPLSYFLPPISLEGLVKKSRASPCSSVAGVEAKAPMDKEPSSVLRFTDLPPYFRKTQRQT